MFYVGLFGYMAKDMHCMPDPSMVAHHFLCGGSAVGNLFVSGGARIFMFGTLILELGSCSVNLTMLLESHKAWTVYRKLMSFASLVIITASHVVAFWCTYVFAYGRDDAVTGVVLRSMPGVGAVRFYCVATPILLYLRQKAVIEEMVKAFSAGSSAKKVD
jgi:hypothetical protein